MVSRVLGQAHSDAVFLADIPVTVDDNMTVQIDELLGTDKLCEGIAGCKYIGDVSERQCIGVILRESQLYIVVLATYPVVL